MTNPNRQGPRATCLICDEVVPIPPPERTTTGGYQIPARPKTCSSECAEMYRRFPICGRCKEPLQRPHPAQRYHPQCARGCKVCGKAVVPRGWIDPRTNTPRKVSDQYCTEACRMKAWARQDLPICPFCDEPVNLPYETVSLRDPLKYHLTCKRNEMRHDSDEEGERRKEYDAFFRRTVEEQEDKEWVWIINNTKWGSILRAQEAEEANAFRPFPEWMYEADPYEPVYKLCADFVMTTPREMKVIAEKKKMAEMEAMSPKDLAKEETRLQQTFEEEMARQDQHTKYLKYKKEEKLAHNRKQAAIKRKSTWAKKRNKAL